MFSGQYLSRYPAWLRYRDIFVASAAFYIASDFVLSMRARHNYAREIKVIYIYMHLIK